MTTFPTQEPWVVDVFRRVLAAVDGSAPGNEAAMQAARLVEPDGALELATAVYLVDAEVTKWPQPWTEAALELEGGPALYAAAALAGGDAQTRLLSGRPHEALLAEASRYQPTLLALGSHGHTHLSKRILGGVSGQLLHEAPCSVLIARATASRRRFPFALVAGVDGSPHSLDALAAARRLSARFDVPLRIVMAHRGDVDVVHAELACHDVEFIDGSPLDVLLDASAAADLVVVGSRGLHGLRALGSVSERVAHTARSSVLVVRPRPT
jgi:nucleotide-binding universal stress UspA family protein